MDYFASSPAQPSVYLQPVGDDRTSSGSPSSQNVRGMKP